MKLEVKLEVEVGSSSYQSSLKLKSILRIKRNILAINLISSFLFHFKLGKKIERNCLKETGRKVICVRKFKIRIIVT